MLCWLDAMTILAIEMSCVPSPAELTANRPVKSIAFSAVSGTQVNKLLQEVQLAQVDGFKAAPFVQAAGQRLRHRHRVCAHVTSSYYVSQLLTWLWRCRCSSHRSL